MLEYKVFGRCCRCIDADPATGRPAWLADPAVRVIETDPDVEATFLSAGFASSVALRDRRACPRWRRAPDAGAASIVPSRRPDDARRARDHDGAGRARKRKRPRAEGDLPSLRGRERDAHEQLRRVQHRQGAEVRVHLRADAGRVPAPDPGLPRCLVRRLQRHLHADASDERQVLHRGRLLGWRRLVQGRRQGRGRRAVPVQRPRGRRRVHVPGRPQRARDGGDHRAGAGAPGRARAHEQRARHHVPDHQHRHDGLRRTATVRSRAIVATARRRTRTG